MLVASGPCTFGKTRTVPMDRARPVHNQFATALFDFRNTPPAQTYVHTSDSVRQAGRQGGVAREFVRVRRQHYYLSLAK